MSWRFPHTVTVYSVGSTIDGTTKLEGNPVVGSSSSVAADFQPNASPDSVYRDWGLELINPAVLFAGPSTLATFAVKNRVVYNGITYTVSGSKKWETGSANLDYVKVVLDRVNE